MHITKLELQKLHNCADFGEPKMLFPIGTADFENAKSNRDCVVETFHDIPALIPIGMADFENAAYYRDWRSQTPGTPPFDHIFVGALVFGHF